MLLGVDYYPEQWDTSLMEADMDRILELGCNVIRIGEFAWHRMEKQEGQFDFSYFDGVIAMAKQKGLQVIFGTPTATPPAWLITKYPDILSRFPDGSPRAFGGRHVACYSNPHYLEACRKIITALAEHYRGEESIVAWQVDNEIGHDGSDLCWCDHCRDGFRCHLDKAFAGDINKLNDTFGTAFWSQEYNSFEEIPLPNATITTHNPALRLEWERFCSEKLVDFIRFQADLLHELLPGAVVMHDFPGGGLTKHVSYADVAACLDQLAFNNYPVWGGQKEPLPSSEIAFGLDYIRGLQGKNFWITEAIMGAQGHDITGFLPRPNQAKLWSWQGMAHGCDGLMYFRYRGATKGAEQFCYGILDADNVPRRRFFEVQGIPGRAHRPGAQRCGHFVRLRFSGILPDPAAKPAAGLRNRDETSARGVLPGGPVGGYPAGRPRFFRLQDRGGAQHDRHRRSLCPAAQALCSRRRLRGGDLSYRRERPEQ